MKAVTTNNNNSPITIISSNESPCLKGEVTDTNGYSFFTTFSLTTTSNSICTAYALFASRILGSIVNDNSSPLMVYGIGKSSPHLTKQFVVSTLSKPLILNLNNCSLSFLKVKGLSLGLIISNLILSNSSSIVSPFSFILILPTRSLSLKQDIISPERNVIGFSSFFCS